MIEAILDLGNGERLQECIKMQNIINNKHMFYFHSPHEDTVATKVGKMLVEILGRTIPPEHELHPLHNAL